jgi:hypothetical protein
MRKILLCLGVVFGFVGSGFGQDFEWAIGLGNTGNDWGKSVITDKFGNIYCTGVFQFTIDVDNSSNVNNLTSNGGQDVFIKKMDKDGNLVWASSYGGIYYDDINSIVLDNDGNIYSIGTFSDTVDFNPGTGIFNLFTSGTDIFIQKLDSNGNFIWAKNFGGTSSNKGISLIVSNDDYLYCTGNFTGIVDFDPSVNIYNLQSSGTDIFVLKLDLNGNFIWAKSMEGSILTPGDNSCGNDITIDKENNIYVTGYFKDTVDFDPGAAVNNLISDPTNGMADVFVQKLDSSGNFIWAKSMGSTNHDYGLSITTDNSNNVYTTGYFEFSVDFNPGSGLDILNSIGSRDIFIQKLDKNGNYIWAKTFGGNGQDRGNVILTDSLNNVYLSGLYIDTVDFNYDTTTFNLYSDGDNDIFLLKLDSNGTFIWANSLGGQGNDNVFSMHHDVNGDLYMTGWFNDTADFNPGSNISNLFTNGSYDIFILKLSQSTGTPITEVPYNTLDVNIFPNPTTGKINLELGHLKDVSIKVHSIDGQLIYSKENINEAVHVFDIKEAAAGVYVVEVEAEEGKMHYKLVKN